MGIVQIFQVFDLKAYIGLKRHGFDIIIMDPAPNPCVSAMKPTADPVVRQRACTRGCARQPLKTKRDNSPRASACATRPWAQPLKRRVSKGETKRGAASPASGLAFAVSGPERQTQSKSERAHAKGVATLYPPLHPQNSTSAQHRSLFPFSKVFSLAQVFSQQPLCFLLPHPY